MELLFFCLFVCVVVWVVVSSLFEKSPLRKGKKGESVISQLLFALPKDYLVFNDLYLEVDGRSVQIDHVVVSVYGIFVIETKNYSGRIFGADSSEYWTQCLYGNKYKLRNPLKQNFSHLLALRTLLNIPGKLFFPIVVFLNKAELKFQTRGCVINSRDLHNVIFEKRERLLTEAMVSDIAFRLDEADIKDEEVRHTHTLKIQKVLEEKRQSIQNGICPKCGSALIIRKGAYGEFLGCENYPRCKFKMNL